MTSNRKKAQQLGMSHGTANNRLRKAILFRLVQRVGDDTCYQCGQKIEKIDNFSIEHKEAWLNSNNPIELFFDLDNIAFSHTSCNYGAKKTWNKGNVAPHGTKTRYSYHGCRCDKCRKALRKSISEWREGKST